ncbi:hypothetical protein V1277_000254 [Bradyrhizobium sp. AZCC 1588]
MPGVTGVRRDRRLHGKGSKGQGPNGQCKASINPAAAASLSAANWQRECKTKASRLLGPSVVPMVLFCKDFPTKAEPSLIADGRRPKALADNGDQCPRACFRGPSGPPRNIGGSTMRSAGWQSNADLPIGAHRGLQHHRGIAREQCPSSSAVARQIQPNPRFPARRPARPRRQKFAVVGGVVFGGPWRSHE